MSTETETDHGRLEDVVMQILREAKRHPVPLKRLQKEAARAVESHRPSSVLSVLDRLVAGGAALSFGHGAEAEFYCAENLGYLKGRLSAIVASHHRKYPYEPGVAAGEIKKRFSETQTMNAQRNIDARLFEMALSASKDDGLVVEAERGVRLPDFRPQTSEDEAIRKLEDQILAHVASRRHSRLGIEELARLLEVDTRQVKAVVSGMMKAGRLVRIAENRYLEPIAIEEAKAVLTAELNAKSRLRVSDITVLLGLSRSAAIPLMEYLDGVGFTRRVDDYRELELKSARRDEAGS